MFDTRLQFFVIYKKIPHLTLMNKDALLANILGFVRLRANGRNNANNVGSCCVRFGSAVQTDATTPNNVGTCSASSEGYNL